VRLQSGGEEEGFLEGVDLSIECDDKISWAMLNQVKIRANLDTVTRVTYPTKCSTLGSAKSGEDQRRWAKSAKRG